MFTDARKNKNRKKKKKREMDWQLVASYFTVKTTGYFLQCKDLCLGVFTTDSTKETLKFP